MKAGEQQARLADLVHTVARGASSLEVACARVRELLDCATASVALVDDGDLVMCAVADGMRVDRTTAPPSALVQRAFDQQRVATSDDGDDVAIPLWNDARDVIGVLACGGLDPRRDTAAWEARRDLVAAVIGGLVEHPEVLDGLAHQSRDVEELLRRIKTPGSAEPRPADDDAPAAMLAIAQDLAGAADPITVLGRLVGRGAALAQAEVAFVVSWRLHDARYRAEAAAGIGIDRLETCVAPDMYVREGERLTLAPAWVSHLEAAAGLPRAVVECSVPVRFCGTTLGAFTLLTTNPDGPTASQRAIVEWLAYQAGAALMSARVDEDLQIAARLKADFIATMSHELRTPLNIVMGYTDLLEEGAFGTLTADQHDVVAKVQASQRELYRLVLAMLDLNRLQAGASPSTMEPVDVRATFAEIAADRGVVPGETPFVMRWDPGDPPIVFASDPKKFRAIVEHLVSNAVKFTAEGRVEVTATRDANHVTLRVTDTGIGMRSEDLGVIFDLFRQLETANTRRYGGVGLGLYLVQRMVVDLGGTIEVTSTLGEGSQFVVRFPVVDPRPSGRA